MNVVARIKEWLYWNFDSLYLAIDKKKVRRCSNLRLIPSVKERHGGKVSYGEWAYVIGVFQTLMAHFIDEPENVNILDIGCGTGLLAIASEMFVIKNGRYTGLDIMKGEIEICNRNFNEPYFNFIHDNSFNPYYAESQKNVKKEWVINSNSQNLITALSVWTHLNETDAKFYMKEVSRVLRDDGKAIITFFYLDELYKQKVLNKRGEKSKFYNTPMSNWIFDKKAYTSSNWFTVTHSNIPEEAIGVNEQGFSELLHETGLKIKKYYPGSWKDAAGIYFQDVMVLEKT